MVGVMEADKKAGRVSLPQLVAATVRGTVQDQTLDWKTSQSDYRITHTHAVWSRFPRGPQELTTDLSAPPHCL